MFARGRGGRPGRPRFHVAESPSNRIGGCQPHQRLPTAPAVAARRQPPVSGRRCCGKARIIRNRFEPLSMSDSGSFRCRIQARSEIESGLLRRTNPSNKPSRRAMRSRRIGYVSAKIAQRRDDERCKPDPERRAYRDDGDDDGDRAVVHANSLDVSSTLPRFRHSAIRHHFTSRILALSTCSSSAIHRRPAGHPMHPCREERDRLASPAAAPARGSPEAWGVRPPPALRSGRRRPLPLLRHPNRPCAHRVSPRDPGRATLVRIAHRAVHGDGLTGLENGAGSAVRQPDAEPPAGRVIRLATRRPAGVVVPAAVSTPSTHVTR